MSHVDGPVGGVHALGDVEVLRLLTRDDLPSTFERWHMVLAAGREHRTDGAEWAGALVLVQQGTLEVDCSQRGRHAFGAGDVIVLGWLPLRALRNSGPEPVRLLAVRRQGEHPVAGFLRVIRWVRQRPPP